MLRGFKISYIYLNSYILIPIQVKDNQTWNDNIIALNDTNSKNA
jgi:hypothetical protein